MTIDNTAIPDIATAQETIGSVGDLRQRWRALMGPLGFSESLLWFTFIGADRRLMKVLNQLPLPPSPDAFLADILITRFGEVFESIPATSAACLITRPGSDGVSDADQAWAHLLVQAAHAHDVPLEPVFRANDVDLLALTVADAARPTAS